MSEKPRFFYKVETTGKINSLQDEFLKVTPDLPSTRKKLKLPVTNY